MGLIVCCMVMCGLINMSLIKVAAEMVSEQEEALFMSQCRSFAIQCAQTLQPAVCAWLEDRVLCCLGVSQTCQTVCCAHGRVAQVQTRVNPSYVTDPLAFSAIIQCMAAAWRNTLHGTAGLRCLPVWAASGKGTTHHGQAHVQGPLQAASITASPIMLAFIWFDG